MIFYFTGTGNSFAAAKIVAEKTGDTLANIGTSYKYKKFNFMLKQEEPLGFVFPVYSWTTPSIVDMFIRRANLRTETQETFTPCYCYVIITCGAFVGNTARIFAKRLLRDQGINVDASFSIQSVDNCIFLNEPAQGEKRDQLLAQADAAARRIALRIKAREDVHDEHRNPLGIIFSHLTEKEEKPGPTKKFYVLPTCTGCGQCATLCPTNTITLMNGGPRWAELGCTQCLSCLHHCPVDAIQYGNKTEGRKRYINPVLSAAEKAQ